MQSRKPEAAGSKARYSRLAVVDNIFDGRTVNEGTPASLKQRARVVGLVDVRIE
jgi:hypothetical protein